MEQLWQQSEGNIITLGLTDVLQEEAGEISYVDIAGLGPITEGESLLNLEASKAAIEVPSPLTGEIVEVNTAAEENPSLLNEEDYATNWIVKIKC